MTKLNKNGALLYEGPSMIDGQPIVVVVTGLTSRSANTKTGAMLQTWILRSDVHPVVALDGEDRSVCGDCPHRRQADGKRSCYVRVGKAQAVVWHCHQRGGYARWDATTHSTTGRKIRIGAYGDPAAVPATVWLPLIAAAAGHTGYTHQWREPIGQWAKGILQASCDGMADYVEATTHGWGTFLVTPKGTTLPAGMAHCAASKERGAKTTCERCTLCAGAAAVGIWAH